MANIYIKKRHDPIDLSNVRAKALKEQWMDKTVSRETIIDLEVWTGTLSQIQSIEMTSERRYHNYEEKPQTEEERRRTTEGMERLGDWVQKQPWYEKSFNSERHYTEACCQKKCSCIRQEDPAPSTAPELDATALSPSLVPDPVPLPPQA